MRACSWRLRGPGGYSFLARINSFFEKSHGEPGFSGGLHTPRPATSHESLGLASHTLFTYDLGHRGASTPPLTASRAWRRAISCSERSRSALGARSRERRGLVVIGRRRRRASHVRFRELSHIEDGARAQLQTAARLNRHNRHLCLPGRGRRVVGGHLSWRRGRWGGRRRGRWGGRRRCRWGGRRRG